jgi:LCP family protein required for cell wall assembly
LQQSNRTQTKKKSKKSPISCCGCIPFFFIVFVSISCLSIYFIFPTRTNILLLGLDYDNQGGSLSRTDTIILSTIVPQELYVGMLSIPRDLWVNIPGIGENRINTAHFFAELNQKNSGPQAVEETIEANFGVSSDYYIRINFDGFREIVNALGGIDIKLDKPMSGYPPGQYHLTGNKALAFVRNRQNSDDFFRMENGQFILKQLLFNMLFPQNWLKLPSVIFAALNSLDTDIPVWNWPRFIVVLLLSGSDGVDNRTINREMVTPYVTEQGAYVLLPDWDKISVIFSEMFGE